MPDLSGLAAAGCAASGPAALPGRSSRIGREAGTDIGQMESFAAAPRSGIVPGAVAGRAAPRPASQPRPSGPV